MTGRAPARPRATKATAAAKQEVTHAGHVLAAQEAARRFAKNVGFNDLETEQITLAVSELASNLVKHAHGGTLRFSTLKENDLSGIRIESLDRGPGLPSWGAALEDGYSTAGTYGTGLGTVLRMMDELDFKPRPGGGLKVTCQRWVRPPQNPFVHSPLQCGIATRSRHGDPDNGDAFVVRTWPGHALVGVIDGVGHSEPAARASQAARLFIDDHFDQSLDALFRGVDATCRRTRGVVMALACFDFATSTFRHASVGNIETRIFGGPTDANFIVRRGVLGANAPKAVITVHPWTSDSILVMHSDGVHTHWRQDVMPLEMWRDVSRAAAALLHAQARTDDDATVLVARNESP